MIILCAMMLQSSRQKLRARTMTAYVRRSAHATPRNGKRQPKRPLVIACASTIQRVQWTSGCKRYQPPLQTACALLTQCAKQTSTRQRLRVTITIASAAHTDRHATLRMSGSHAVPASCTIVRARRCRAAGPASTRRWRQRRLPIASALNAALALPALDQTRPCLATPATRGSTRMWKGCGCARIALLESSRTRKGSATAMRAHQAVSR